MIFRRTLSKDEFGVHWKHFAANRMGCRRQFFRGMKMYMKIARGLLTFSAFVIAFATSTAANAQLEEDPSVTVQPPLGGNQTVSITLPAQVGNIHANYYRVHVDGDNFTWVLSDVEYELNSTRNGRTLGILPLTLSIMTSGLPVTGTNSTSQFIEFTPCTGPVSGFCDTASALRFHFKIDPTLTVSPSTTIATDGSSARTVQLVWPNALSGATINANCDVDAGVTPLPTITVSPTSPAADASGKASFTIYTTGLKRIGSSGSAPSGRCTFRAHGDSMNVAKVEVLGQVIAPNLTVSPSFDSAPSPGSTTTERIVTVKMASPMSGVTIDGNCQAEGTSAIATLTTVNATNATDANGEVRFRVKSEKLISIRPTSRPHVRCKFNVRGFPTYTSEYFADGLQITSPSVSLSLGQITQTGTTQLTATMSPAYPGFSIAPSCSANQYISPATATPTSTSTNENGQQTFDIGTPTLVITNPDTNAVPSAYCMFLAGGVGTAGMLQFRTGNTCTMSLSPLPPACGNPVQ